jgi:hypothetical protein
VRYPQTVKEVIKNVKYNKECITALKAYKEMKPWRGSEEERIWKMKTLHWNLNLAYRRTTKLQFVGGDQSSYYEPGEDLITIVGNPSVITYLHEYAHALYGASEKQACRWSINLFRKIFPRSYRNLKPVGHMLRRQANV